MDKKKMMAWIVSDDTGVSSETLWSAVMNVPYRRGGVNADDRPYDVEDFGRCYRLVKQCGITSRDLNKVVETYGYWKPLIDNWNKLCCAYKAGKNALVQKELDSIKPEIESLKCHGHHLSELEETDRQETLPGVIDCNFDQGHQNTMASELVRKLNAAIDAKGDKPVINSPVIPAAPGEFFNFVVYHEGDGYFMLE